MKKEVLEIINKYINGKTIILEEEFRCFLSRLLPDSDNYYFQLMELYEKNILYKYNTGLLKPCNGRMEYEFLPIFEEDIQKKIVDIDPPILVSGWAMGEISRYMSLQLFGDFYFVETFSFAREAVLNVLLESGYTAVYEEDYLLGSKYFRGDNIYIIRTINGDSPIVRPSRRTPPISRTFITTPKIEKIIVDMIIDPFFDTILGDERINILKALLSKYQINMATISRYAKKRYRFEKVMSYIEETGFNTRKGEFE